MHMHEPARHVDNKLAHAMCAHAFTRTSVVDMQAHECMGYTECMEYMIPGNSKTLWQ